MTPPAAAASVQPRERRAHSRAPARPLSPPRRVSGPARRGRSVRPPTPGRSPAPAEGALAPGLLHALQSLSDRPLLDRLIRGRAWIAIVAFALIGIVTLQLGLLELNSGIGRALERQQLLQRENSALSIEDSELAAGERVEAQASRLGMQLVPQGALRFLAAHPGADVAHAVAALKDPARSAEASAAAASSAAAGSGQAPSSAQTQDTGAGEAQSSGAPGGAAPTGPASAATPSAAEAPATPARSEATGSQAAQAPAPSAAAPAGAGAPAGGEVAPAGGTQPGATG